jgi:hypothetical protein
MANEDQFRNYFPLMRRVIMLVAVLTAVPVILWTITVFVRGYFGPPKIAAARPLAAVVSVEEPATPAAASQDAAARPPFASQQAKVVDAPPVVEARATVTDARTVAPAAKGGSIWDRQGNDAGPPSNAPSAAMTPSPAPGAGDQRAADQKPFDQRAAGQKAVLAPAAQTMPAAPAMPDASTQSTGTLAAQDPPDTEQQQTADAALPAGEPIAGPVPLPRHRPRYFAMLQNGVPMPRPRPDGAGAAAEGSATPLDWLQKLFTPPQQQ